MQVVAGSLDLCNSRIRKLIREHLVWVAHAQAPVQEVSKARILVVLASRITYDVIDVGRDSVHVYGPLDCLVVVGLSVDQVVHDEVGHTGVSERALNYVSGFFASLTNHGQVLDLLDTCQCFLLSILSSLYWRCVEANDAVDVLWEQSRSHHGCLGSEIVTYKRILVKPS